MIKFGQKLKAKRFPEDENFEDALGVREWNGYVACVFKDGVTKLVRRENVLTKMDEWRERNREKIRRYQREWNAKKRAEELGISISEYVYRLERRHARVKRDPKEKKRQYWRDRQKAHRARQEEAADE